MKTVIFDIGNVLMGFDFFAFMRESFDDEKVIDRVARALFGTGYWEQLDIGLWTDEQVVQAAVDADPEIEEQIRWTFEHVGGCMHKRETSIPWIKELKSRGYQVLYLSNYSPKVMHDAPEAIDFLPYVDGGVFSCYVNKIKPDPEIYMILKERYNLVFSQCVFIDDTVKNLDVAEKLGIHTIHFENYEQAHSELDKMLQH